jgi:hypothetical protein
MTKPTLPESIMAQSYGLTGQQIATVEMLGAMLDRAKATGAIGAAAWIEADGTAHLEVEFEPCVVMSSEGKADD